MKLGSLLILFALAAFASRTEASAAQTSKKSQEIVRKARAQYVMLREKSFQGYSADMHPDWLELLAGESAEAKQRTIERLKGLEFQLSVDRNGHAEVRSNGANVSPDIQKVVEQLRMGFDHMMGGFFDIWSLFVVDSPFPDPKSEFRLSRAAKILRVAYKQDASDFKTDFLANGAIVKFTEESKDGNGVFKPHFLTTKDGLLLSGYDSISSAKNGSQEGITKVKIGYQEIDGFQLPSSVEIKIIGSGTSTSNKFAFDKIVLQPAGKNPPK